MAEEDGWRLPITTKSMLNTVLKTNYGSFIFNELQCSARFAPYSFVWYLYWNSAEHGLTVKYDKSVHIFATYLTDQSKNYFLPTETD